MATLTAVPDRSFEQRMVALEQANIIRSARAQLKRDLKAGREQVDGMLLSPPAYLDTFKVFDLLLAVPRFGRVKVNKILAQCRISPSKTVGGLTERQRLELVEFIGRGPVRPARWVVPCPGCGGLKARTARRCLACYVTEAA